MQFGLKNRLRLISLLPILVLFFITSYFAYESFTNYRTAQALQDKLSQNRQLNALLGNISQERGITVMYLGNSSENTLNSLIKQRKIVDDNTQSFLSHTKNNEKLHDHTNGVDGCKTCSHLASLSQSLYLFAVLS